MFSPPAHAAVYTTAKAHFPSLLQVQVGLVILTAATHPPASVLSLVKDIAGLVSLTIILVMDALNWLVFGPKSTLIMTERIHQGISQLEFSTRFAIPNRFCRD